MILRGRWDCKALRTMFPGTVARIAGRKCVQHICAFFLPLGSKDPRKIVFRAGEVCGSVRVRFSSFLHAMECRSQKWRIQARILRFAARRELPCVGLENLRDCSEYVTPGTPKQQIKQTPPLHFASIAGFELEPARVSTDRRTDRTAKRVMAKLRYVRYR